ncbi:hypothetical protein [Campylobacter cuniculorum]|uniref:Uncharacterized protein n=2 Tax=Campylobacter cuniculorum TaxID=374106 RepID=A0ABX6TZL9_9BACT|nr:hypothetical protein [Campylobacter cuniculorum]ARJ55962.1 putative membrane protein [Campylobacter cuniculorum DSM 23162 = LMG 24588]QOR05182.1 hypothetical protein A0071_04415 [Campylobacter cuniculorum]
MIEIYIFISALAFLLLYFAVKKLTLNVDEKALIEPIKAELYPKFCDYIDQKIKELREDLENENFKLLDETKKSEFLEKLGDLNRELVFIQTMNLSKKNDSIWQSELFGFLKELENLILKYLEESEKISEDLRQDLMQEFQRLKNS